MDPLAKTEVIQARDLNNLAKSNLGLIIGPSITTTTSDFYRSLGKFISTEFSTPNCDSIFETIEIAVNGNSKDLVSNSIDKFFEALRPSPLLNQISRIKWSAVISTAMDDFLEQSLREERRNQPVLLDYSVITDFRDIPPPKTIPIYKFFGSWSREDYLMSQTDYMLKVPSWSNILNDYSDLVKASPTLCIGLSDTPWFLELLLAHMQTQRIRSSKIILLADDPLINNNRIKEITGTNKIIFSKGSMTDILGGIRPRKKIIKICDTGKTQIISNEELNDYGDFFDLIEIVNNSLRPSLDANEKNVLLDYLFQPETLVWDPYFYDLDFIRSVSKDILSDISDYCQNFLCNKVFLVHGSSASGKTTVLKRIAFELAKKSIITLWFKIYNYGDAKELIQKLFKKLKRDQNESVVVLFIENPHYLELFNMKFMDYFSQEYNLKIIFVVSIRTSDLEISNSRVFAGGMPCKEYELPDRLDDSEWEMLPEYIHKIGVCKSLEKAIELVKRADKKNTRDTLVMLYYLLPETRQKIESSIRDEFIKLGNNNSLNTIIIGEVERSGNILKEAYCFTAVSSEYGAPLPVEILVSALNIDYNTWLDYAGPSGQIWGILYPDDDSETASYRTRNEVVNRILIKYINGGSLNKKGQIGILKKLLASCRGTQSVFHSFCMRVLMPKEKLDGVDYQDGLDIYDTAIKALPFPERVLHHHRGLWIRKEGKHPDEAIKALKEALTLPDYPYSGRKDPDEHIHTSLANAYLDKIYDGSLSLDEGKLIVLKELEKSRSPDFINANAVHTHARLVIKLADRHDSSEHADIFSLMNKAISEIDRTLTIISSSRRTSYFTEEDFKILENEKIKILNRFRNFEAIEEFAKDIWDNNKNQSGFVLASRYLMSDAIVREKGKLFKYSYDYWLDCLSDINRASQTMTPEFAEIGIMISYNWMRRSRRANELSEGLPQRWEQMLRNFKILNALQRIKNDCFYSYLYGLLLAHLGDWQQAQLVFSEIRRRPIHRRIMFTVRDFLVDSNGAMKRFQGKIERANKSFIRIQELKQAILLSERDNWGSHGDISHCYIGFSFAGPIARRETRFSSLL